MPPLPRPNPGPEPWPSGWGPLGALALGAALTALIAITAWWRSRPRRGGTDAPRGEPRAVDPTDGDDIASWSVRVRAALAGRFGPGWIARTTEEIAASDELAGRLGTARFGDLTEFLREADRVKFGGRASPDADWRDRAERFLAADGTDGG
jgi:hypothetical protein